METRSRCAARPCRCDHHAEPLRIMRSVGFNRDLAQKISTLELSGDATIDRILTELLDHREGRLFDTNGKAVNLNSDDASEIARWDGLFSEDQRRFANRYKERTNGGFKNRLQERLIYPVMMMAFAMAIHECRHTGKCAGA